MSSLPLNSGFCVCRPSQFDTICWDLIFFFLDSLLISGQLFRQSESINVTGVIQEAGMLTKGPTPDPKGKLNTLFFLKLQYLLDCSSCSTNSMPNALLLQMIGDGIGGRWLIYITCEWGDRGQLLHFLSFFFLCFFVVSRA